MTDQSAINGHIAALRQYLADHYIMESCGDTPVLGCASCDAAALDRALAGLANCEAPQDAKAPQTAPRLTLTRRSDNLRYCFTATGTQHGRPVFSRDDTPSLTLAWHPEWGWCTQLPRSGPLTGLPWGVLPRDQGPLPPEGPWVSRKDDKSYVYDLRLGSD